MTRRDTVVRALLGAFLLGTAAPSFAQADVALTLDQALREALAHSPLLAVERPEVDTAAGTLRQARLYPVNPELELEGSAGRARALGGEDAPGHRWQEHWAFTGGLPARSARPADPSR